MEQIAYIDLSKGEASTREIPEELLRLYLGGIGLNAYLLYNHAPTGVDALDPANPLIFGAGLFNGYPDSSASRFQVSGKSPETGIYGTGNSGGFWGPALKHAGFQHLVLGRFEFLPDRPANQAFVIDDQNDFVSHILSTPS